MKEETGLASAAMQIVLTTVGLYDEAQRIAWALVEQRLAACVQIDGPIESVYRWEGQVATESEYRCTIKTSAACLEELVRQLRSLHPYDVPQIICLSATAQGAYGAWLNENTGLEPS